MVVINKSINKLEIVVNIIGDIVEYIEYMMFSQAKVKKIKTLMVERTFETRSRIIIIIRITNKFHVQKIVCKAY